MTQILDSIKGMITPEMIQQASAFLGEDSSKVSSGIKSMIPGILGGIMKKGDSPEVQSALKQAADQHQEVQSQTADLFNGQANPQVQNMGNNFLNSLFGSKLGDFTSAISKDSGMSQNSSNKLVSMVAPIIASVIGKLLASGKLNLSSLLGGGNSGNGGGIGSMLSGALSGMFGHHDQEKETADTGSNVMDMVKGLFK